MIKNYSLTYLGAIATMLAAVTALSEAEALTFVNAADGSDGVSNSSTGGTITTDGGDTIHTFTSSGTWTMVAAGGSFTPKVMFF